MYSYTTQSGKYLVTVHGNGWAYEVEDQNTKRSLWFQDDDAIHAETHTHDFEDENAIADYFDLLD